MVPSDRIRDEFIEGIHSYNEELVKDILCRFLNFGPLLGADKWELEFLVKQLKDDKKDALERIKKSPYQRRLLGYLLSKGKFPVYDSILWVIDLLPSSPREALNVIDAYSHMHLGHLPDGRIHGLFDAEKIIRARYFDAQTDTSVLYSLTPDEFEHVVEALYHQMGYKTKMTKKSHDGGRDVIVTNSNPAKKEKNVVSCKRVKDTVKLAQVREVFAPIEDEKATKGTLVTTSDFSSDAYKLEKANPRLELINQVKFQRLLNEHFGTNWSAHLDFYIKESQKRHPDAKRI